MIAAGSCLEKWPSSYELYGEAITLFSACWLRRSEACQASRPSFRTRRLHPEYQLEEMVLGQSILICVRCFTVCVFFVQDFVHIFLCGSSVEIGHLLSNVVSTALNENLIKELDSVFEPPEN